MNASVRRILVVGGNGFIGTNYVLNYSNLCYHRIPVRFCSLQGRAQARDPGDECEVVNIQPLKDASSQDSCVLPKALLDYLSVLRKVTHPHGHPTYLHPLPPSILCLYISLIWQVDWQKGDALYPQTFTHLFPEVDGVVHTLGSLLEDGSYKKALKENDISTLLGSLFQTVTSDFGGPLEQGRDSNKPTSYEVMNRDSGKDFALLETQKLSDSVDDMRFILCN
jgi:hypothetical protein